jgi:hypothetical protein
MLKKSLRAVCGLAAVVFGVTALSTAAMAGSTANAAVTCASTAWSGSYYATSKLSGTPKFSRCDSSINFDWKLGSPSTSIPVNSFSTHWSSTRTLSSGTYRFTLTADDGARVLVDGSTVIDQWHDGSVRTVTALKPLGTGSHTITVDYYEHTGGAIAKLDFVNSTVDKPAMNRMVRSDDFNGTGIGSQWSVYNSAHSANPLANVPSLAAVSGGMLKLTTKGLSGSGVCMCRNGSSPTAPYGRWEVRARMSRGGGNGGVVMLWPNAENWPVGGELDMAEISKSDRQAEDFVVHYSAANHQYLMTTKKDFTQWHTFSIEWTSTQIRYWIDGTYVTAVTDTAKIPKGAMHVVIQAGPHGSPQTRPQSEMDIDWIHVFQK